MYTYENNLNNYPPTPDYKQSNNDNINNCTKMIPASSPPSSMNHFYVLMNT